MVGAGSASAQSVGAPGQGVRDVDWHGASFTVPAMSGCPRNHVEFSEGAGTAGDSVYRFTPNREITYADVTGDGVEDALILMDCGPRNSEYSTALIAMTTDQDGDSVRPLGTVASPAVWTQVPSDHMVWYGDIAVAITDWESERTWTEYYRWAPSAQAFVRVDGP
ncbi:hypothetical protein GCM10027563_03160 [Parasphingorhabdus pacifica]